ncbi:hypothetical protein HDV62DRAFT_242727 [Trichoderma sp. SZMC 28011]
MSDAMSITPISGSELSHFQTHNFSWVEDQYSEIDFIQFTDAALKSTSALGCGGESWLLGLSSTSLNDISNVASPETSRSSAPEEVTRESSNSDGVVDTTRAPRNAPRKRPGRYKNAPAHVLNRRREQCRVAQQKHRQRKDNRIAQLEKELKTLKEEHQIVLNAYMLLDKAYKAIATEVSSNIPEGVRHVRGFYQEKI